MDLLIHVGLHKTGTTTVQNSLQRNRNELLSYNILYPESGLSGTQHSLIPGTLIADHFHLNQVDRSLDASHYVSLLNREVAEHQPSLVVISSEVFSENEILLQDSQCKDLIATLGHGFSCTRLLVSLRSPRYLALSSLKSQIRDGSFPAAENPIGFYSLSLDWVARALSHWQGIGLPCTHVTLETARAPLAHHFFASIFNQYHPQAANLFVEDPSCLTTEAAKSNADPFPACFYLLSFLLANAERDADSLSAYFLALPETFAALSFRTCSLFSRVSDLHLIRYLDYFIYTSCHQDPALVVQISMEEKLRALAVTGLDQATVHAVVELSTSL
jgi:hypothetical protein